MEKPRVVIVIARCSNVKQPFGIRFEEYDSNSWIANWAFTINEQKAKNEGYEKNNIKGVFAIEKDYPGCPYCKSSILIKCSCGKVACWDGETQMIVCPWCNAHGNITGIVNSLISSKDR